MKRTILSILFLLLPSLATAQQALIISNVPTPSASCTIQRDAANTVWQCNSAVGISQPLTDSLGLIANATTPTKILKLDVSAITAATTRTWTIPDANITVPSTIASLGANVMTGLQTLNGGLAATTGTFSSTLGVTGASTIAALSATTGTFSSTLGVTGNLTLSGTGNAVGTITSGVWNAGAVTATNAWFTASNIKGYLVFNTTGSAKVGLQLDGLNVWQIAESYPANFGAGVSATTGTFSGTLTVNGFGTHAFSVGGTGGNTLQVSNTTAGTGNLAAMQIGTDSGAGGLLLRAYSSTYTTGGQEFQSGALVQASYAGGISIAATHASGAIRFYSGGATLRWSINTIGSLIPEADGNYNIGDSTHKPGNIYTAGLYLDGASGTGTSVIWDAGKQIRQLTSSARYKEHISPWSVTPDALQQFVALTPQNWDYKSQRNGAVSFTSEQLAALPILNAYGRNPLINYDSEGQPESNRDYGLIAMQHLVLQAHDTRLQDLAARVAALEAAQKEIR